MTLVGKQMTNGKSSGSLVATFDLYALYVSSLTTHLFAKVIFSEGLHRDNTLQPLANL